MQTITNLFENSSGLQNFVAKLEQIEQLNQALRSQLEPGLADNCQVSNLRNGILILTTSSPAWNHKLRFLSIDLLSKLRKDPRWCGLKSIEVKVDYMPKAHSSSLPTASRAGVLSKANAEIIRQTSELIPNHGLAEALRKLAKRSRQPSKDADRL